jgi:phytol kinase
MGLGDAAASMLGRRYGRHPYSLAGCRKSWEGSAAMAVFSFAGILVGTYFFQWEPLWLPSLAAALVATVAEAPAGRGLDNLTVPISAALTFLLVQGLSS